MRSGTPKTKKSKKKDRGTVVEVMRSPSVELTGQQGMQWLMHMLNNNVLPQPRRVRKENMEVEGAAIVNDIFHSMTSVIYGDQETDANNRLAENGEAPAARSLTHMSDAYHNIVSDQSTNRPTLLKEPEPSPQAQELIQALKKMLKLEENIKLSVTLATASCDELIKIPLNLPQTEIFLLFLRNHGYNVIVVNSLKSEAKSSPLYFPVSLRQAQSLVAKARQQEWFGFSLPFTRARLTFAEKFYLRCSKQNLIVLNKNKQLLDGEELAMLNLPLDDFPSQLCLERFVKLYDLLTKYNNLFSLRVINNMINVIPNTSELQLEQFSFVLLAAANRKPFYQLKLADAASFDDAKLAELEHTITVAQQRETIIRKYQSLRGQFGDRFMPALEKAEVVQLSLDDLIKQEAVLIDENDKAVERKERLRKNSEILKCILLNEFARGKQWVETKTSLVIQPLSVPGQALLELIAIDGMRIENVDKAVKAEIDFTQLELIDTAVLQQKSDHAKWLGTNINLLDVMVCSVCIDPKNRFTKDGIEFVFKQETLRDKFLELLKQENIAVTAHPNGLYSITYAACNKVELSAVLPGLQTALQEFITPKHVQNDNNKPVRVVGGSKMFVSPSGSKNNKGKRKDRKKDEDRSSRNAAIKSGHADSGKTKPAVSAPRPAVQGYAPKVAAVQPMQRAVMPPPPAGLDREILLAIANASVQEHDFTAPEKPAVQIIRKQDDEELEQNNPHKGAILVEIGNLEKSANWYAGNGKDNEHRVTHLYSIELAMLRLMNALDLRHAEDPALEELTDDDREAAATRSAIIHGLPTLACLMNISDKLRNECKLKEIYNSILTGKLRTVAKSKLSDFMKLFEYVNEDPLTVHNQSFADLEILLSFYARRSNDEETEKQIKRAIKGCVVKIGEHSKISQQLFNEGKISHELCEIIQECREYRNTCSHNDINSIDFDPLPFESAFKAAAAGLTEWLRINRQGEPEASNSNNLN